MKLENTTHQILIMEKHAGDNMHLCNWIFDMILHYVSIREVHS